MLDNVPDTVLAAVPARGASKRLGATQGCHSWPSWPTTRPKPRCAAGSSTPWKASRSARDNPARHQASGQGADARALVVDISGVANPMDELDNLARVCTPDVKVLVIGEDSDVGLYRELVRNMGVAEYVHKPLTRDHVTRLFVPQIAGVTMDASASRGGSVIAVCGARGGVGHHRGGQPGAAARRCYARACRIARPASAAGHHGADARREAGRRAADCTRTAGARGRPVPRPRLQWKSTSGCV